MSELTDRNGDDVTVRVSSKGNAYAIYLADGTRAGAAYFVDRGSDRIFHHTIVGDEYAGRGLGSLLVREALAAARSDGFTVVPSCQFVDSWIRRNDYDGPVSAPTADTEEYVLEHAGTS